MNLTPSIGGKKRVLRTAQEENTAMQPKEIKDVKAIAALAYNSAADLYDAPPLSFWDRIGRRTVQQLSPQPGACVLDACCGSGHDDGPFDHGQAVAQLGIFDVARAALPRSVKLLDAPA